MTRRRDGSGSAGCVGGDGSTVFMFDDGVTATIGGVLVARRAAEAAWAGRWVGDWTWTVVAGGTSRGTNGTVGGCPALARAVALIIVLQREDM